IDTAASRLATARAARPQSWELFLAAGEVAMARKRPLEAMTFWRQAAWQFPDTARFWGLAAEAALQAGQGRELLRSLEHPPALHADSAGVTPLESGARDRGCR